MPTFLRTILASGLLALGLAGANAVSAATTFTYQGTVTDTPSSLPFAIGMPMSFTFTFDELTPDANPGSTTFGDYPGAISSYTMTVGPYSVNGIFPAKINIINDLGGSDLFHVEDSFPVGLDIGVWSAAIVELLLIQGTPGDALLDDTLPTVAPDPSAFDSSDPSQATSTKRMALLFRNLDGIGAVVVSEDFTAVSLTPTPIPAALPLFVTALAGLGFFGWRRRRKVAAAA